MTDTDAGNGANGANGTGAANAVLNAPPPPPPFYESFQDAGVKEWASKAAFKSPEDVAKIAQKFDAYKDADPAELVRIAKDAKPEDALKIMQERFGAPTDGAAYKLTEIEGVDKTTAEWAQGAFAKAGLAPWQAQLIASEQMAMVKAQTASMVAEEKAAASREDAALKVEWGPNYTPNIESARRAFKAAGIGAETIAYLESGAGYAGVMKLGAYFGKFIKEGEFIDGNGNATQGKTILEKMYPNDVAKDRAARG